MIERVNLLMMSRSQGRPILLISEQLLILATLRLPLYLVALVILVVRSISQHLQVVMILPLVEKPPTKPT